MKKITSIVMATAMAVVMCVSTSVSAFAANVQSPTAATVPSTSNVTNKNIIPPTVNVNGQNTSGITYRPNETNANEITFVYEGDGTFIRWEQNLTDLGLVEGTDYTLVLNADDSMTITFISVAGIAAWENGRVVVNAIVEFDDEDEPTTAEETTKKKVTTTAKKNSSSKSPATGVNTGVAAGIAAAAACVAVLAAAKKKDAE